MQAIKIGVDVGNYDTKTQHCTIASGYKKYSTRPDLSTKILTYNGAFYVPDISERMPYTADKTENDQCLILTLFGIAEELLYTAKVSSKAANTSTQVELDKIRHIKLGVGLPPGHFAKYSKPTLAYYQEKFAGVVTFNYKGFNFEFEVDTIRLFPQDFVAVYKNAESTFAKKKRYYIVGIGGGTTDVIPVFDGSPDANNCFSLEMGTRVMYRQICADIQRQFGEMLDEALVEDVLRGEETVLPDNIQELIKAGADLFFGNVIKGCVQQGVKLSLYPVIFFGGGALLFKSQIENNSTITSYEIIEDTNANAKAYAACLS